MDTQDFGTPRPRMIGFIPLTRDTGETFFVRADMISAMGQEPNGRSFIRIDGAIDHVRESAETILALMNKA
jgi:uncharacterized protein YlzI (FlbEa/FlbD family)